MIKFKLLGDVNLPAYQTPGAAGMDIEAHLPDGPVTLQPRCRELIPTGFAIAIPDGFEGQIRPRSGLAAKSGVTVLNAPGTIDSDYRGEVKVLLVNLGNLPVSISNGQRVAQLVIAPVTTWGTETVDDLDETARADGGFGSTDTEVV